jgi:hypothetical protein
VRAALALEQARERAKARAAELASQLSSGGDWSSAAADAAGQEGVSPREVGRQDAAVPQEVASAAFRVPASGSLPAYGAVDLASGDAAVWAVSKVRAGTDFVGEPGLRANAQREAREFAAFQDATVYVDRLRAEAEVKVNEQLFR